MRHIALLFLLAACACVACEKRVVPAGPRKVLVLPRSGKKGPDGEVRAFVEVASTREDRERGLMYREALEKILAERKAELGG